MSKTVMRNIRLVNWYGFHNVTIPVAENLTLISGENECGKSTILDAIKYAYTWDAQFNKATSGHQGTGKRNLLSYTRCLMDASAGIYARPAEKIPTVYTHIALEYEDQVNERPFVLGVIIETAAADIRSTAWYALDGKCLSDIDYVYLDQSVLKPYDISGFQKRYAVQMKGKKDGITLFMQMTGLKLPYQEVFRYQRKLRSIMAYNPAAKIQEFIRESVLEAHNVNFDKLKEAKKNIEQINLSLEQINQELADLDRILKDYEEHGRRELRLKIDDIKAIYQSLVKCQGRKKEIEEQIHSRQIRCRDLERMIEEEAGAIDEIDAYYAEARHALKNMDVAKAILASEELLQRYKKQLENLEQEKEALERFQTRIRKVVSMLEGGERCSSGRRNGGKADLCFGRSGRKTVLC
ncbi:MAG: AAA family ATPase [Lachnospiraceae bacterium]|nr:AAA family ATPase [Lachnospiraceae bacterium]